MGPQMRPFLALSKSTRRSALSQRRLAGAKEEPMPLITIKVFENEIFDSQTKELIHQVTEAVIPFVGEKLRDNTWVLTEEIASRSWGIGGEAFGLKDVRAIQSRK
jgi:4-oxalocrotonate tautomerase family enzyme